MIKDPPPWLVSPIFRDSPRNKLLVVENMELDASERGEKHWENNDAFCGIYLIFPGPENFSGFKQW